MSEQDGGQATALQRPTNDDTKAWKAYWEKQGQPWRTEPEIDEERQKYLAERRSITPDIEQGIYPFKDIRLSRADIEWLIAIYERQHEHVGLDLRGADLHQVNLQALPLMRMHGGLNVSEWKLATSEQREWAAVHLELANLWDTNLNDAFLRGAHLEGANLRWVELKVGSLRETHLEGADLRWAHLEGCFLQGAHLEGANLKHAHLEGKPMPMDIYQRIQQWNKEFPAILPPANLQLAFFNSATQLRGVEWGNKEYGFVFLADIRWGDVNLAMVNWAKINMLGDERVARQKRLNGKMKDRSKYLIENEKAVRANRQLAVTLQAQGLNEVAARFVYRAQLLQRRVFWYQRKFGQFLFSLSLDLLAGYGYKPWRSFLAYLVVITSFALIYFFIGRTVGPSLSPIGAWVFSMTSFHGRGFFPGGIKLDDPLTIMAAIEAFVGLLIEVTFIATLTQRLFGK